MKEIKLLVEKIEEELEDACSYAELALEYRAKNPEMANLFYKLSHDEMTHMDMLHKRVESHIEDYRREHGDPPVAMMAVYDFMHKRFIEKAEKVTMKHSMYKH